MAQNTPPNGLPPLPEGYEPVDDQEIMQPEPVQAQQLPPLPEGYEPAPEMPGAWEAFKAGVGEGFQGFQKTREADRARRGQGPAPTPIERTAASDPFEWNDLQSPVSELAPKITQRIGESSPVVLGGIAGAAIGAPAGPIGSLIGGTVGSAVTAAAQTLGPIYAEELKRDPSNPDQAYERAFKSALTSGAFSGAGWALFPLRFFQDPIKKLSMQWVMDNGLTITGKDILAQTVAVQPAIGTAEAAVQNQIRPDSTMPLGQAFAENLVTGAVMTGGQMVAGRIAAPIQKRFFDPKGSIEDRGGEIPVTPEMLDSLPALPEGYEPVEAPVMDQGPLPEDPSELPQPPPVPRRGSVEEAIIMIGPRDDWSDAGAYGEGPAGRETGFRQNRGKFPLPPEFPGVDPSNTPFAPEQRMMRPFSWVKDKVIQKYLETTTPPDAANPDMVIAAARARGDLVSPRPGTQAAKALAEGEGPQNENFGNQPGRIPEDQLINIEVNRYDYNWAPKPVKKYFNDKVTSVLEFPNVYGKTFYLQESLSVTPDKKRRLLTISDPETGQVIIKDRDLGSTRYWDPERKALKEQGVSTVYGGHRLGPIYEARQYIERKARGDVRQPGTVHPLQLMRMSIEGPERPSEDNTSVQRSHIDDVLEAGPVLRGHIEASLKEQLTTSIREAEFLDALDTLVPRYVYDDPNDRRVLTGFEIEQDLALRGNDPNKPGIYQVSSFDLDPTKITAELYDLPRTSDNPRVKPPPFANAEEARLFIFEYAEINDLKLRLPKRAEQLYQQLLDRGMRVVPSRGAGFIYGGSVKPIGPRLTDAPPSTRSAMYFRKTAYGYVGEDPHMGTRIQHERPERHGLAVDWAKVPEGAFISLDPFRVDQMVIPKGKEQLAEALKAEFTNYTLAGNKDAAFADLIAFAGNAYKEGVYIPFKHSVLGRFEPSSQILQVKPIPDEAFTVGYTRVGQAGRGWDSWQQIPVAEKTYGVEYLPLPESASVQLWKDHGKQVYEIVQEVRPILDRIVQRLGGKSKFRISVVEGGFDSPGVWPDGRIIMPAEFFFEQPKLVGEGKNPPLIAGDLRSAVLEVLKHELGHAITLRTFDQLPSAQQAMISKAYYRALLDYEIRQDLSTMETVFRDTNYQWHHITFVEWMAEQFRRWTHTDGVVLNDMDRYFRDTSKSIQEMQGYFLEKFGPEHVKQKFTSTWAFNEWMDYLEYAARDGKSILDLKRNSAKLEVEYPIPLDLKEAFDATQAALREFGKLVPEGTGLEISDRTVLDNGEVVFGGYDRQANVIRLMVGSLAWLKTSAEIGPVAQRLVAHEAFHSIEDSLTPAQKSLLVEAALKEGSLTQGEARSYRDYFLREYQKTGLEGAELQAAVRDAMAREYRAHLIDSRANGKSFGSRVDQILDAIIQFIERVGNAIRGKGFHTAEDIIKAFYDGELTRRANEQRRRGLLVDRLARAEQQARVPVEGLEPLPGKEGIFVRVEEGDRVYGRDSGYRDYFAYDAAGNKVARLMTDVRDGEYYIQMIELLDRKRARDNIPKALIDYAEQSQGYPFRAAQEFTQAGYKWVQRHYPEKVKYYVWDERSKFWFSPKFIWEQVEYYDRLKRTSTDPSIKKANFGHWRKLAEKIPPEALEDKIALSKQWMMREFQMSQLEKARLVRMGQMSKGVTGDPQGMPIEDGYSEIIRTRRLNDMADARDRGDSTPAPAMPQQLMMWRIGEKFGKTDPEVKKLLQGTTKTAADKLGWFGERFMSIRQLAWRNPHISGLRNYIMLRDQENSAANAWIYRAQETAKAGEKLSAKQSAKVADLLYWAQEMDYLSRQEKASGVVRQPTLSEIQQKARLLGMDQDGVALYARVTKDFVDYLTDTEAKIAARIRRDVPDPAKAKPMLDQLAADMALLKARPYFPMMRFGEYTLTGRDPATGEVIWFSAYGSVKEREADIRRVHSKFQGNVDLRISKVPEYATEFMGLPKPLLDRILNDLPVTSQQADWIKRFSRMDMRDTGAKARAAERRNTPGYSLDWLRTYAFYFRNAARYLAQVEYQDQINKTIQGLEQSVVDAADSDTRSGIVRMVKEHNDFVLSPGKEWTNLKAFVTHYQLGMSVAAAGVNLTQVPMVALPYLSSLFSSSATKKLMQNMLKAGRHTWDYTSKNTPREFLIAREEVIRQGKIDTGQAAELGTFAESGRFDKLRLGSGPQKFWRNFQWVNMYLFQHAERFNREWVFKAAYDLAMAEPKNKHVLELADARGAEKLDIMARTGLSEEAANALLVAREAIDRTQGVYQQWDRPKFLRPAKGFGGQMLPAMQIFFSFTQQTMFQLFNNPGGMKMLFMIGLLAGMSGLPGAEDLDNAMRYIARSFFGKDFSLLHFTRERMNELAKGTIFEPVAADLALNGISRYGFGMSLLSDAYAPQFDASASMSFGQLVPGATPLLRGLSNAGTDKSAWKSISGEMLKDAAGPGFGPLFTILQYLSSPPYSDEQKKWEGLLPRAMRGLVKAYRYAESGAETSSTGARIAEFDWADPQDRATIIAQALGFTPRKLAEGYEAFAEASSQEAFYKARKLDVLIQFDRYAQSRDPEQLKLAREALIAFNMAMKREGRPEWQIGKDTIQASLQARARARAMTEEALPNQKRMIPMYRDTRSQWPGLVIDEKKVK
jgi:hypothetical protein